MLKSEMQEIIDQLKMDISDANNACNQLLVYLASDKFISSDHELNCYVNISDVHAYVMRIRENL